MAQTKYRRSAKPGGFNPVQVGGQNISRMREESQRVAQGMRDARDAEIQDRQRVQAAVKEDQAYTRRATKENQAIAGQNSQNKIRQIQLDAEADAANFATQQETAALAFKSVADLSATAAKKAHELEQQKFDEDYAQELINYDPSSDATIQQVMGEGELAATTEEQQARLDEVEANGGNPLGIAQARSMSAGAQYARKQADANYLLSTVYPQKLQEYISSNPELIGSSGDTAAAIATFQRDFFDKSGLRQKGYRPEMLRNGLASMRKTNQGYLSQSRKVETNNLYEMQADTATTILTNNPEQFTQNAPSSFRTWARNPNIGYAGALKKYEELATVRGPDGEFLYTMDQLGSVDLKGTGKAFAQEWAGRFSNMQQARLRDDNTFRQAQVTADNLSYKQDSDRILKGLISDSSKANAEAAVEFFRDTYGRVPPEIQKFAENYTNEAVDKAEQIERFEEIPNGLITQEAVDAALGLDYKTGEELKKRFAQQEVRYNQGEYKAQSDSFKGIANGLTTFGSVKANSPSSVFLQSRMRAVYRQRVDQAVAGGMDFNTAASTIGMELAAEVKTGALDEKSMWYRGIDKKTQMPTFPNLTQGNKTARQAAEERYKALVKNVADNGVEKVINTAGSIITAEEAAELISSYGTPGFTVPADVLAVAGMSNGSDPFVIMNKQLEALGEKPLDPPESFKSIEQVSPTFKNLLFKTPSVSRSIRGNGGGNAGTFNPSVVPNGYGELIQQSAQTYGVDPIHIAALAEIESGFDPKISSYNGSSFGVMQINRAAHPLFFQQADWKDPQANIAYGTQYYAGLVQEYNDPVAAAMAYNAGPGNYDAYVRGELPDGPVKTEMLNHGKKFAKAMYKYGKREILTQARTMRPSQSQFTMSTTAASYIGMDTSSGPDGGNNACVWALNKVMRTSGIDIPWGNSVYVPEVKNILDKKARRVEGPQPGAIAIMQDNGNPPYPHIGIVGPDGLIISNSSSRGRFDWQGTPAEYEQKYGRPNLYYMI